MLDDSYAARARACTKAWYIWNVLACNKLGATRYFSFPFTSPLPATLLSQYDLIVSFYAWPYFLLNLERAADRVIVDLNDVMAARHDRIGVRRWVSLSPAHERRLLTSARCVAISEADQAEFANLYGVAPPVAPFIPPTYRDLVSLADTILPKRVGFLAARAQGNEAVLNLISDSRFLARLSQRGYALVIAGGICDVLDTRARARLRSSGATVVGRIHSLRDFYSQVGVVLNPAGPSTGVKIKSVEALIAGRRLVATAYGTDPALRRAFSNNILLIPWPPDPVALADSALAALDGVRPDGCTIGPCDPLTHRAAVDVYVAHANTATTLAFAV